MDHFEAHIQQDIAILTTAGYEVEEVAPDGNCLFRASLASNLKCIGLAQKCTDWRVISLVVFACMRVSGSLLNWGRVTPLDVLLGMTCVSLLLDSSSQSGEWNVFRPALATNVSRTCTSTASTTVPSLRLGDLDHAVLWRNDNNICARSP